MESLSAAIALLEKFNCSVTQVTDIADWVRGSHT
jgi:hypothetical protein